MAKRPPTKKRSSPARSKPAAAAEDREHDAQAPTAGTDETPQAAQPAQKQPPQPPDGASAAARAEEQGAKAPSSARKRTPDADSPASGRPVPGKPSAEAAPEAVDQGGADDGDPADAARSGPAPAAAEDSHWVRAGAREPDQSPATTPGPSPAPELGPAKIRGRAPEPPAPAPIPSAEETAPAATEELETAPPAPVHEHRPSLFIVHVTPEMAPVAKIGGLADVVFGLGRELAIRGNHVEIILPKYDNLRYDHIHDLHPVYHDLWVPWYEGAIHCTVYFGFVHDRKCFFIEPHSHDNFFSRGRVYGFADDVLRFAFFSRAAMEFLWQAGKHPDILHCHDWQTALVPVFLYELYQQLGMTHPRACLTIHNFKHQGVTGGELLRATGLHHPERYLDGQRMGDNRHPNALNLLKAGVVYSNFVTTVSPRYAFETKDQGQGFGLEPTLHTHHLKYGGVINGIDYDVWNPEIDRYLPVRYGLGNIDAKYDDKRALRHRLMLADNDKPIVAFIGRLDPQKGLELVRHAIFYSLERGAQFVLLGSSPYPEINDDFWGLKHTLNESPDCHLEIGFDDELAHLIYAGADIMLVPSQFEPCGLTQLIALRYGTVPVVRTVGGLTDTVFDKDHSDRPLHERNGYRFDDYDAPGLESALGRAIACYYQYPEHFRELMRNAMRADFSWNHPGQDYLNIYDLIRDR